MVTSPLHAPHAPRPPLADPALPAFEEMLGSGAAAMLETALGDPAMRVQEVRRTHVTWTPGRHAEVRYVARIGPSGGSGGASGGEPRHVDLVAATGSRIEGVPGPRLRLLDGPAAGDARSGGRGEVAVWEVAADPLLPGLRAALDPEAVRALLQQTGVPPASVSLRMRAYRPLRRAVVEVRTGSYRLFLKVVPPAEAEALQARHHEVARHVSAPASHGWSAEHGILVLQAVPGQDLHRTLVRGHQPPPPADLAAVLAALPVLPDGRPARSGLRTALRHVPLLQALSPEHAPLIEALQDGLRAVPRPAELVPVHGDFHAGQVLVEDGRVTGLLDLDTVGLGEPVGDWATIIAQAVTSAALAPPAARPALRSYAARLVRYAQARHGRRLLAAHVAGNLLGLATGPFRVQMEDWRPETARRLLLAARWARHAGIETPLDRADG